MRSSAQVQTAVQALHRPSSSGYSNRRATLALGIAAALVVAAVAVAGAALSGYAAEADFDARNLAPSFVHPFGTDWMGRDMLCRTVSGLALSIFIGTTSAVVSAAIAAGLAVLAVLGGKRADALVTWLVDLFMGIPHIVLLVLVSFAVGKGFFGVMVAIALTHWPALTRVLRAEIMQVAQSEYISFAKGLGANACWIARRHILPAVLPQFLVGLILLFPHAVMHEAAITFLGFGLPPESSAIGVVLSESMSYLSAGMWWQALFPGLALVGVVMLFDVAGSCVRKLVDPHSSQE